MIGLVSDVLIVIDSTGCVETRPVSAGFVNVKLDSGEIYKKAKNRKEMKDA